jgi:hypothetical protein
VAHHPAHGEEEGHTSAHHALTTTDDSSDDTPDDNNTRDFRVLWVGTKDVIHLARGCVVSSHLTRALTSTQKNDKTHVVTPYDAVRDLDFDIDIVVGLCTLNQVDP